MIYSMGKQKIDCFFLQLRKVVERMIFYSY